jgi:6,7-dimethyl-8-ribityllumazine synthase
VICLGVLIRGATSHYDLVAQQTASGIARVFPATGVPCIFGVVTAENLEQAAERCGSKMGNRGWDAAHAAVEMVNLGEAFDGWAAEETMLVEEEIPGAGTTDEPAPVERR